MKRFAVILTILAAMLSGGGVARFAHMVTAHGGDSCVSARVVHAGNHAHGHAHDHAHGHAHDHAPASHRSSPAQDDCPVCDELAVNAPAPCLHAAFVNAIAFLEIAHDREAAQLPAPHAPDAVSARPPPSVA